MISSDINAQLRSYEFQSEDFDKAFSFGVDYYLSKELHTGRTSGEPRGLGAVLDAFTKGKLNEIGVQKMIELLAENKKIILDFEMKNINEVKDEPDIIEVKEKEKTRNPNLFIEIKLTSPDDRWIGLTEEQLSTMKNGCGEKKLFIIYSSIGTHSSTSNPCKRDLVGMYLKKISNHRIFNRFADFKAFARLEFILSEYELNKFGTRFTAGELLYETNLFDGPVEIRKKNNELRKNIREILTRRSFSGEIEVPLKNGKYDKEKSTFQADGSFKVYEKKNRKTYSHYIECLEETTLKSNIFGEFILLAGKSYKFNLETLGRDPILKRNNVWIAKRMIYQLIQKGKITNPNEHLLDIAREI
jgi:hypothetical protein